MTSIVKQRIVGAIVLVVLFMLLTPFLFGAKSSTANVNNVNRARTDNFTETQMSEQPLVVAEQQAPSQVVNYSQPQVQQSQQPQPLPDEMNSSSAVSTIAPKPVSDVPVADHVSAAKNPKQSLQQNANHKKAIKKALLKVQENAIETQESVQVQNPKTFYAKKSNVNVANKQQVVSAKIKNEHKSVAVLAEKTSKKLIEPKLTKSKKEKESATKMATQKEQTKLAEKNIPTFTLNTIRKSANQFIVEINHLETSVNARKLVAALQEKGFRAYSETVFSHGKSIARVKIGPLANRLAAEKVKSKLNKFLSSANVVG